MVYDLSNELRREQFKVRANALYKKGCVCELTEKKPVRTLAQNRYLHVILAYFGLEIGESMEYVKQTYFKELVNREIFFDGEKKDKFTGKEVQRWKSTKELNTDVMTLAIERFRTWASTNEILPVYLPSSEDYVLIQQMECELERNAQFL